jgi:hypothetical protein
MSKDIRFILIFLIIALAILVYLQTQSVCAVPNNGNLDHFNITQFPINDDSETKENDANSRLDYKLLNSRKKSLSTKENINEKKSSMRESKKVTSRIIDNILKNDKMDKIDENENELDNMIQSSDMSLESSLNSGYFNNPINNDVNYATNTDELTNSFDGLDELIRDVNTGDNLIIDTPQEKLFAKKTTSINSAKKYRKVSYADSKYRIDFNGDEPPDAQSKSELDSEYEDSLIFKNENYSNNNNYTGYSSNDLKSYGKAELEQFTNPSPQTQQEKILSLYNSNEYLPNSKLTNKKLEQGFQILENPVSVTNSNLIPVLQSIPVSSVLGSKRNSTYDIRAEPPCPKTVVAPFLNSSIMPDIYATQRGCL